MTRLNVYAGPAGFYLVRGGPAGDKAVLDSRTGTTAVLPGPAPKEGDPFPPNKTYYEIPIAIQDRSFNTDGSLFYPDTAGSSSTGSSGPYIPETDVSPIWNPEFFGNMIMVNGNTWPFQTVEKRRYRLRFLNGCQSRFLILDFNDIPGVEVWQIGNEGGFLAAPVNLTADNGNRLLMGLAERADLIVDFTDVPVGQPRPRATSARTSRSAAECPAWTSSAPTRTRPARCCSSGSCPRSRPTRARRRSSSAPGDHARCPAATDAAAGADGEGRREFFEDSPDEEVEGPVEALLGTVDRHGVGRSASGWTPSPRTPRSARPRSGSIYNATADAHPMHIHEVAFEVVNRAEHRPEGEDGSSSRPARRRPTPPESWENRVEGHRHRLPGPGHPAQAQFAHRGQFVWHCHIVEHEDNEMMRPYRIGPPQPGQPD